MKEMVVSLLLRGDGSRLNATLQQSQNRLKTFSSHARREFETIKNAASSLSGKLAGLGISFGAVMLIKQSAQLDQSLTRIGQTADMSRINVMGLRKELFRMSKETGQSMEDLKTSFDVAVQSGLKFKEALPVTDAVNKASAVTNAKADILTSSLTTAAAVFDFDLSKPGQALLLLDKMRVAGKLGKAEMENLASIFPRVGFGAKRAGMNFDQTLAFVEGLSQAESNPERLATLSASWLRLFTNQRYMQKSQEATGVKFFDKKGARRDALEVFADIKSKFDLLKTDAQKHSFISNFLEGADTETITASVAFLEGKFLKNAQGFSKEIDKAAETINKELPDAINNAVPQVGRLTATLREAADEFSQHLNKGITEAIKKLIDSKTKGGFELSGKELAAAAAAALGLGYVGHRLAGPALKKFIGKLGGTGLGIAEGKLIEAATGVTPVFVTNMPTNGLNAVNPASPGKETINTKGSWLKRTFPFFTKAGLAIGIPAGSAFLAHEYLESGGSTESLGSALHGMPESGLPNDAWLDKYLKRPSATMPMIYNNEYKRGENKNEFTFNFRIDKNDRIIGNTSTPDANIKINLFRGDFGF